ncbi:hypothetical protein HYH03_014127 [Edaphochlamys debaryana]|uniref:PAS domain-containing protein n=1 Tax=Edaphochlamys debaryana TaxID=47281 RepID=A0A836BSA4_9CHLO|nr:hypothetical protein HYH03_014127 [Edaphochlamys debaryana]|eukprot:KAG2487286.1 hypothetical protein HYH03_014127 [Edaphochlamys debaryana]
MSSRVERQSSFGSQGSGRSSATKIIDDANKHRDGAENENQNNGFTTALFGVLFTLAKEKYSDSWKIAVLTVVVDFLLILAIMLNLEYPWVVDPKNALFKFFWMLELHKPLAGAGYKFYLVVFYILSGMLYLTVGICVWVAWCFKNDSFAFLWPIKFVRVVASLFFGMLYIMALNIFLVLLECAPEHGVWMQHLWHVECFGMPHLIHAIVALVSCFTFAACALLLVVADHDLDPMVKSLLAAPHSMTELKAQLAKTIITVVDVLLWDFPRVQGAVFAVCCCSSFYFHMKQLPYYTSWMNSFRLCFLAVHAWVAVHLCALVFTVEAKKVDKGKMGYIVWEVVPEDYTTAKVITDSMAYGIPVVFFAAGIMGAIRLLYFFKVALKFQRLQLEPNLYSKRIHRFGDDKYVEICSRVARVWDEDGTPDPQYLDLAETIIRAGIQQFPKSPYLHIVYANFLIECRQQLQSGWAQLEEARRMPLNLSYRFSIFTREQEHKQKAAVSSSGESAADLVSYVEFQRNWRLIQSYHKAALMAMREFWRLLLNQNVNLNHLTSAFRKIEMMERLADKTYKTVLERYPKAVKLLRSYANFLETVKNDPWTAAQYYSEAEKQEEALENAEQDMGGEEGLSMRNSAIITINAMGIIQMANKHAIKMLGYNKGELDSKNISCIMPQPFSARHNGYLRNYVTTGKAKILDSLREVVALHRDRYVFPIRLMVTKSAGTGADATFMGLLKEVEPDPFQVKAWLMPNGVTLCVDQSFTDYAGWAPNDLIGKPFTSIAAEPSQLALLLEKAAKMTEEELGTGTLTIDTLLQHKYAEEVPVSIRVEMGGTGDQRLLVLAMTRRDDVVATIVFDHHGRVLFANQALCSLLGTKPKDMRGKEIATLLPQPYGYLHARWFKEAETSLVKPPPSSCRANAVHSLVSSNGVHVPVRSIITSREIGGVHMNIVRVHRVTPEEALDEQRMHFTVNQHGHVTSITAPHHGAPALIAGAGATAAAAAGPPPEKPQAFGFAPENALNRKLYELVDIFQEWHGQGHSVMHAVKALGIASQSKPGSAWRVGVLPQHISLETEKAAARMERDVAADKAVADADAGVVSVGDDPTNAPRELAAGRRGSIRRSSTLLRNSMPTARAAIMQVLGPEHTPEGTQYVIKLWRPELLGGVMELNDRMTVIKADTAAGLIFGVPATSMFQQPLSRFLKLGPPGAQSVKLGAAPGAAFKAGAAGGDAGSAQQLLSKESLLGNTHAKGGMKGKVAHRTGPRRVFEARHMDGLPLQISLQVAMKNGNSNTRLMALIKPLNMIRGNTAVLHALMRGEDIDHGTMDNDTNSPSLHKIRAANAARSAAARAAAKAAALEGVPVPKLELSRLGASSAVPVGPGSDGTTPGSAHGATAAPPGMGSARTLNAGGSGAERSGEVSKTGTADPSTARDSAIITARDVGLDLATPRPDGELKPLPADPKLRPKSAARPVSAALHKRLQDHHARGESPDSADAEEDSRHPSDDSAMARSNTGVSNKEPLAKRYLTRDWDQVAHQDPDHVPMPNDADFEIDHHLGEEPKDVAVSSEEESSHDSDGSGSGSDSGSATEGGTARRLGVNTGGAAEKMTREEALQRKRTMATLEPGERVQYVKGVKRVKEWLASGYYFDRKDAEPEDMEAKRRLHQALGGDSGGGGLHHKLSGLNHRASGLNHRASGLMRKPSGLNHRASGLKAKASRQLSRVQEEPLGDGLIDGDALDPDDQLLTLDELAEEVERQETLQDQDLDVDGPEEGKGKGEEEHEEEEEEEGPKSRWGTGSRHATHGGHTERASHHGGGGDDATSQGTGVTGQSNNGMSRGRRLKRLLKLLSGQKVQKSVNRLRLHVWVVIGIMLAVHAACFLLLIVYINKQKQFITEIAAAGEAIDRSHYAGMYSRAIEAAARSSGHEPGSLPAFSDRLNADVDRLEFLHQGLYLGFKGLRRSKSEKLNDLWDDPQWNVTVWMDTKVPTTSLQKYTLWNLGGDIIAAAREVAFYASTGKLFVRDDPWPYDGSLAPSAALSPPGANASASTSAAVGVIASNVTLTANRFWLFLRDNVGESLYVGYLRVLNTLLMLAQDNIAQLKLVLIVLLLVEGCAVCFVAIGYVFWLLWKATRARAALFTVFLVIPQGQVRALASRHITTTTADDDDSDDEDKGDGGGDDGASDGASVVSGANGGGGRRSFTNDRRSIGGASDYPKGEKSATSPAANKKGIKFNEETESKHHGQHGTTVLGRLKHAISGDVTAPTMGDGASTVNGVPRRFHTRKRLTHTTSDIKQLAWPFFAWGVLIVIIYLVSYLQFASVETSLVNLKMFQRSTAQASRCMYYANELALEQNTTVQAVLQAAVMEEAGWLDTVYSTTLYGGRTLEDSAVDGAHDTNKGSLFAKQMNAAMLFEAKHCLRGDGASCFSEGDKFYEVSRNAIDPMMRRLMTEARMMALDDLGDVNHTSDRWQYIWQVAQVDLHDGLEELTASYEADALAAFTAQGTLHTIIFGISWALWGLYIFLLLKPYLAVSSTETKRVAELLSQLPTELDVEGMVEESWLVVADTQIDKSGLSVWDARHHSVATLAMRSAVSVISAFRRLHNPRHSVDAHGAPSVRDDLSETGSVWKSMIWGKKNKVAPEDMPLSPKSARSGKSAANMFKGGLDTAPQVPVSSSAFLGGGKTSPTDSAEGMRGSLDKHRPGSGKPGRNNKVAPASGGGALQATWLEEEEAPGGALPAGAQPRAMVPNGAADGERPLSPLLDLPMTLILPPVADENGAVRPPAPHTADSHDLGISMSTYGRVMTVAQETREFDDDHPWVMPSLRPKAQPTTTSDGAEVLSLAGEAPVRPAVVLAAAEAAAEAAAKQAGPTEAAVTEASDDVVLAPESSGAQIDLAPKAVTAARAAAAADREKLGGSGGAADAPLAAAAAAGSGSGDGVKVMERKTGLDRPASASSSTAAAADSAAPLAAAGAAGSGSLKVVDRKTDLNRPASAASAASSGADPKLPAPPAPLSSDGAEAKPAATVSAPAPAAPKPETPSKAPAADKPSTPSAAPSPSPAKPEAATKPATSALAPKPSTPSKAAAPAASSKPGTPSKPAPAPAPAAAAAGSKPGTPSRAPAPKPTTPSKPAAAPAVTVPAPAPAAEPAPVAVSSPTAAAAAGGVSVMARKSTLGSQPNSRPASSRLGSGASGIPMPPPPPPLATSGSSSALAPSKASSKLALTPPPAAAVPGSPAAGSRAATPPPPSPPPPAANGDAEAKP